MKKSTRLFCAALFITLLAAGAQPALANATNRLNDAGFEQKLSPEQGGWTMFDESNFSQRSARSGTGSMYNWGFSQTVPSPPFLRGTVSGSFQEFDADPGSRWRMNGYGSTPTPIKGASAFGIVQISFFDADGNDLGTVETADGSDPRAKTSNQINSSSAAGEWIFLDTGVVTAPDNTAKVHAFTLFVDYSGTSIAQGIYFDDLVLCSLENGSSECQ